MTTEDDALRLLSGGEVALIGLMPHSSNYTFLAELRHPDDVLGVYKPRKGERPLWDFPEGTLYRREVAAFELSRALGWPAVPPTIVRDGPHGPGSMQLFVEVDPTSTSSPCATASKTSRPWRCSTRRQQRRPQERPLPGGRRRHHLVGRPRRVLPVSPKLRSVIWEFAGERIPDELLEDVRRVAGELRSGAARDRMTALLDRAEVDAAAERAEDLVRSKRFPEPGSERPFPWPPGRVAGRVQIRGRRRRYRRRMRALGLLLAAVVLAACASPPVTRHRAPSRHPRRASSSPAPQPQPSGRPTTAPAPAIAVPTSATTCGSDEHPNAS